MDDKKLITQIFDLAESIDDLYRITKSFQFLYSIGVLERDDFTAAVALDKFKKITA